MFNHFDFTITYHSGAKEEWGTAFLGDGGRIVNVKVDLSSIDHTGEEKLTCDDTDKPMFIPSDSSDNEIKIKYTYSVNYKVSFYFKYFI